MVKELEASFKLFKIELLNKLGVTFFPGSQCSEKKIQSGYFAALAFLHLGRVFKLCFFIIFLLNSNSSLAMAPEPTDVTVARKEKWSGCPFKSNRRHAELSIYSDPSSFKNTAPPVYQKGKRGRQQVKHPH